MQRDANGIWSFICLKQITFRKTYNSLNSTRTSQTFIPHSCQTFIFNHWKDLFFIKIWRKSSYICTNSTEVYFFNYTSNMIFGSWSPSKTRQDIHSSVLILISNLVLYCCTINFVRKETKCWCNYKANVRSGDLQTAWEGKVSPLWLMSWKERSKDFAGDIDVWQWESLFQYLSM
jgi:hypothetical protein